MQTLSSEYQKLREVARFCVLKGNVALLDYGGARRGHLREAYFELDLIWIDGEILGGENLGLKPQAMM